MILVNNRDEIEWEAGLNVERLLDRCGFTARHIYVWVNDRLVERKDYAAHVVADGDHVRVMHMLGGG